MDKGDTPCEKRGLLAYNCVGCCSTSEIISEVHVSVFLMRWSIKIEKLAADKNLQQGIVL
jgi:CRISPR/Cas system-associated endonuclease Cas3-HD